MADETKQPEVLWVKSTLPILADGGSKVALSEYDAAHPTESGWILVAGANPTQVARTAEVDRLLRAGTLVEAGGADDYNDSGPGGAKSRALREGTTAEQATATRAAARAQKG